MFKQFDRVQTTKAFPSDGRRPLSRGSQGTIVDIYRTGRKIGYHVEFTYKSGKTKALLMLGKEDIEPITEQSKVPDELRKIISIRPAAVTTISRPRTATARAGISRSAASGQFLSTSSRVAKKAAAKTASKKKTAPKASKKPTGRKGKSFR